MITETRRREHDLLFGSGNSIIPVRWKIHVRVRAGRAHDGELARPGFADTVGVMPATGAFEGFEETPLVYDVHELAISILKGSKSPNERNVQS